MAESSRVPVKAYDRLLLVLRGELEPEALGKYWEHTISFPIYQKACQLLALPRHVRLERADQLPARIAELVKLEMIRVHRNNRALAPAWMREVPAAMQEHENKMARRQAPTGWIDWQEAIK